MHLVRNEATDSQIKLDVDRFRQQSEKHQKYQKNSLQIEVNKLNPNRKNQVKKNNYCFKSYKDNKYSYTVLGIYKNII